MITVVTAPSRSGTSLTMQMLQAAGVPLIWNCLPNRTVINPRGHYELHGQDIPAFISNAPWVAAVKVMPWHLKLLPDSRSYQFIVLLRDITECRQSHDAAYAQNEWVLYDTERIEYWRDRTLDFVRDQRHITVTFDSLFTGEGADKIGALLRMTPLQVAKMRDCVDPTLRHYKVTS